MDDLAEDGSVLLQLVFKLIFSQSYLAPSTGKWFSVNAGNQVGTARGKLSTMSPVSISPIAFAKTYCLVNHRLLALDKNWHVQCVQLLSNAFGKFAKKIDIQKRIREECNGCVAMD